MVKKYILVDADYSGVVVDSDEIVEGKFGLERHVKWHQHADPNAPYPEEWAKDLAQAAGVKLVIEKKPQ